MKRETGLPWEIGQIQFPIHSEKNIRSSLLFSFRPLNLLLISVLLYKMTLFPHLSGTMFKVWWVLILWSPNCVPTPPPHSLLHQGRITNRCFKSLSSFVSSKNNNIFGLLHIRDLIQLNFVFTYTLGPNWSWIQLIQVKLPSGCYPRSSWSSWSI